MQAPKIVRSLLEGNPQYGSPVLDQEVPEAYKRFHEKVDRGAYDPNLDIEAEDALEDLLFSHLKSDRLVELVREGNQVRERDEMSRYEVLRRLAWEAQEGPVTRIQLQEGYQGLNRAYKLTVMNCDSPAYQLEMVQN